MKIKDENKTRLKILLIIAGTTLAVYLGFRFILPLILPFLFAYFLAWLIRPSTEFLYRKLKIPRIIGGTVSLGVLMAVIGTALFYLCNTLMKQAIEFIRNIPVYLNYLAGKLDHICSSCDDVFGLDMGTLRTVMDENLAHMIDRLKTNVMPGITHRTISFTIALVAATGVFLIILISAVLIVKDLPAFRKKYEGSELYKDVHLVTDKLADAGVAYLRTQLIIMAIVAVISFLGLTIMKNQYALMLGLLIALMDALPILGSGIIYIPWAIVMLVNGNIYAAAILITSFLVCQIFREILEPKLIGNRIGVKPLFTLVSMYIGVKLFSIAGFVLGPVGLIIIITVVRAVLEKSGMGSTHEEFYEND
jgi:sporulation integral membrane protein YtvI